MLQRVTIDEDLCDLRNLSKDILELFGSDVLTLRKLEDILRTVDDSDCTIWQDYADITRVDPAIISDCILGLLGVLEVSLEVVGALELHLTTRRVIC